MTETKSMPEKIFVSASLVKMWNLEHQMPYETTYVRSDLCTPAPKSMKDVDAAAEKCANEQWACREDSIFKEVVELYRLELKQRVKQAILKFVDIQGE